MNHVTQTAEAAERIGVMDEVEAMRAAILAEDEPLRSRLGVPMDDHDPAVVNLLHYLALRRHDLRPLQRRLMRLGLSSLGRLESRVMPTLDSVLFALAAMTGRQSPVGAPDEAAFFAGEARLDAATDALFGDPPTARQTRIMVTLPSEAAVDAELLDALVAAGMDVARINCAHDDAAAWRAMAGHARAAGARYGRRVAVLMDIAGPKIRTAAVALPDRKARIVAGDRLRLVAEGPPRPDADVRFSIGVTLPEMVTRLEPGHRIRYDDGKLEAVVEQVGAGEAVAVVRRTKTGGAKLKPEKGVNLPDTELGLSPLTAKDETDLASVIECADMIGYSFVSRAEDIDLLDAALAATGGSERPLGLIAKIEQPEALRNLPALIARARRRGPFGVMIARGDLAAELGFERTAEMQEEILWLCEAASVPAIWATQVLEDLVKDGVPSRGEMTDAAMAVRAECVMLNKGPDVTVAVAVLDRLLQRMDDHMTKKTPLLRALATW
jgi:pyruvate kinase